MIYDQLHQFTDKAAADAAFGAGTDEDGRQMASWLTPEGVTVMPATIWLHDPGADTTDEDGNPMRGRIAASGYWLGLAVSDADQAAALQALPSCRIAYERPEAPTPWREAVTWSAMPLDSMTVIEAGSFAGSGYIFD